MIKNWLSRYSSRYPRSLVYMMQASEYIIPDYLAWYHKTSDFSHVERRKRLVKTPKAVGLLAIAWAMIALIIVSAARGVFGNHAAGPVKYVMFFLAMLVLPSIIAYGMALSLFVIKIIQWPVERLIMRRARQILRRHRAVTIGIAGSFGKTTMREILKTVLSEGKKVAAPPHSYNTPLSISRFVQTLSGDEDVLIFELGEYCPGDIRRLCHLVQPTIGIITGINEAHLQKFKSLDQTAETIYELADYLGERPLYVNGENELAKSGARPGHIVYNREGVLDWRVANPKTDLTGISFTLAKEGANLVVQSALLGLHQIGPLAVAADIARRLGLSPDQITNGISKTKPFAHRMEPKTDQAGVVTIDDSYNGNPDGVAAAIEFLTSLEGHRRWYMTPGLAEMGARTQEVHRQIGRTLAKASIEKVILIKDSVTSYIAAGLHEAEYRGDIIWYDDALAAFAALPHLTIEGDVVLLQNDWPDQYQ